MEKTSKADLVDRQQTMLKEEQQETARELADLMRHYARDVVIEDFSVYRRVQ